MKILQKITKYIAGIKSGFSEEFVAKQIERELKRSRVGAFRLEYCDGYYIERVVGKERIGVVDIGVEDYEFAQKVCDAMNLLDALGGFNE